MIGRFYHFFSTFVSVLFVVSDYVLGGTMTYWRCKVTMLLLLLLLLLSLSSGTGGYKHIKKKEQRTYRNGVRGIDVHFSTNNYVVRCKLLRNYRPPGIEIDFSYSRFFMTLLYSEPKLGQRTTQHQLTVRKTKIFVTE